MPAGQQPPRKKPNSNILLSQSVESSQEIVSIMGPPIVVANENDIASQVSSTSDLIQPLQMTVDSSVSSSTNSFNNISSAEPELRPELEVEETIENIEAEIQAPIALDTEPDVDPEIELEPELANREVSIPSDLGSSLAGSQRLIYVAPTPVLQNRPAPEGI